MVPALPAHLCSALCACICSAARQPAVPVLPGILLSPYPPRMPFVYVSLGSSSRACHSGIDGRWRGGEPIRPAAHYWLLITAFSPETHTACSFPLPAPSSPSLHCRCTARGSSSRRHACHQPQLAMSSSFSLCSSRTAPALLLLSLLLSARTHSLRHAEPWELSLAFLASELSRTRFLPFSCLLGTFQIHVFFGLFFTSSPDSAWANAVDDIFPRFLAKMLLLLWAAAAHLSRFPRAGAASPHLALHFWALGLEACPSHSGYLLLAADGRRGTLQNSGCQAHPACQKVPGHAWREEQAGEWVCMSGAGTSGDGASAVCASAACGEIPFSSN